MMSMFDDVGVEFSNTTHTSVDRIGNWDLSILSGLSALSFTTVLLPM